MKRLVFVSAMLACSASQATEPLVFYASAKIDVDVMGRVTRVEPSDRLSPALQSLVKSEVASYRFEAPLHNGVRSAGTTYVVLGGCAVPDGDDYKVSLDYKSSGPRVIGADFVPPPRYPQQAYTGGYEAEAVVSYTVQVDGTAVLDGIGYKRTPGGKRHFDKSLREWVGQFRYEPEIVAGNAVKTRLEMSVSFRLDEVRSPAYQKKLDEAERITKPECTAAASTGGLEPVALDSPFRKLPSG